METIKWAVNHMPKTEDANLPVMALSEVVSYPDAEILGHRDLPNVHKDCPAFDVKRWLKLVDFHI